MSSVRGPIGWTPSVDDDDFVDGNSYVAYHHLDRPFSPSSSTSSLSDLDPSLSRSSNNSRYHDPGWVARPRNAFIIFRCEYSQIHCQKGRRIRRPPGSSTEPTVSKRAAMAWRQMTNEEKEPYKIRAEEERDDHARKYPDYRFRPQRRPGVGGRRYNTRHSISSITVGSYPSPESTPESRRTSISTLSSGSTSLRPSTSKGSAPGTDPERRGPLSGWTLPSVYNTPGILSDGNKSSLEIMPARYVAGRFDDLPTPNFKVEMPDSIIRNSAVRPPLLLSWNGEPSSAATTPEATTFSPDPPSIDTESTTSPDPFATEYPRAQESFFQYTNADGSWLSYLMHQYSTGSVDSYDEACSGSATSDYTTLYTNHCTIGDIVSGDYFGPF